ncbi:hypothetical protein FGG08_002486 [Glutinoglossum americanum]|uniref:Ankyrin repeat protein n=1 Tax=Glutinoglossum americanum TaxID=1670608 RepID=A0A9P8I649_9PEZI|nr:hypothetical protein FGG08_002486 [Glutinoglossum americanum]
MSRPRWRTALLEAVKRGDLAELEKTILVASNVEEPKRVLQLGLQFAAAQGSELVARSLLEKGAEINTATNETPALFRAVEQGHISVIRLLLSKGANIEATDKNQRTVLFPAVLRANHGVVKLLLDEGRANVNARDAANLRTPLLHLAAEKPGASANRRRTSISSNSADSGEAQDQIIQLLLGRPDIDLEAKDRLGRTALHWAAVCRSENLMRRLLLGSSGRRADLRVRTPRGKTALHLAAAHGHAGIVGILLEHGADCKATSDGEWTALHMAAEKGHTEVVRVLLHSEANINAPTARGTTPLHWASSNGHAEVVRLLLSQPGIKRHLVDKSDYFPLILAGEHGQRDVVELLSSSYDGSELSTAEARACGVYKARVTDFFPQKTDKNRFAVVNKPTVYDLLYRSGPKRQKPVFSTLVENGAKDAFRWIHLPANNALITKYFTERDLKDVGEFKVLADSLRRQQHRGKTDHSVFMKPSCDPLPPSITKAGQRRDSSVRNERKRAIDDKRANGTDPCGPVGDRGPMQLRTLWQGKTVNPSAESTKEGHNIDGDHRTESLNAIVEDPQANHVQPRSPDSTDSPQKKSAKRPKLVTAFSNESTASAPTRDPRQSTSNDEEHAQGAPTGVPSGNVAFYMPYLHFETDANRSEMREIINDSHKRQGMLSESEITQMSKDELLIHAYLVHDQNVRPKLHLRRTLDQFYYPAIDTEARDQDQVVYRYCKRNDKVPKIFMVDQLWLWILNKDLIITSFPQRWKLSERRTFDVLSGIIEGMSDPKVTSVYDLASRITDHCSGVFYEDRHDNDFRFLDMFESSIGDLENREPELVADFNNASKQAKEWFDSQSKTEKYPQCDNYFMNIGSEMMLLAEIKDVRNELQMISEVLERQSTCLEQLDKAITTNIHTSVAKKLEPKVTFAHQIDGVKRYLEYISSMNAQAEDLYQSKYAGVFEARYSRQQAVSAARQGHVILVFTIVTIIFVPRQQEWCMRLINPLVGIGLAISVPLIIGAFTVDDIPRLINRLTAPRPIATLAPDSTDICGTLSRKRRPSGPGHETQGPKKRATFEAGGISETVFNSPPKLGAQPLEAQPSSPKQTRCINGEALGGRRHSKLSWPSRPSRDLEKG